jgi:hypothetical protein
MAGSAITATFVVVDHVLGVLPAAAEPLWGHPLGSYGSISSVFGDRNNRQSPHEGIDFWNNVNGSRADDPIFAAASGTIHSHTGWAGFYGQLVVVDHGGGWTSLYAHTVSGTHLPIGAPVSRGQKIANIGNTSATAIGAHLHFETKLNGTAYDPAPKVMQPAPLPGQNPPEDDMFSDSDRALLQTLVGRAASPVIPMLVQTADTSDTRLFVLMENGTLRHIGPTEKSAYVARAVALGYASNQFDRLFVHRVANIGALPTYTP